VVIILSQCLKFSVYITRVQIAITCFVWLSEQPTPVFLVLNNQLQAFTKHV